MTSLADCATRKQLVSLCSERRRRWAPREKSLVHASCAALNKPNTLLLNKPNAWLHRSLPPILGHASLRSAAGPQSPLLEEHLRTLLAMKAAGRLRYVGTNCRLHR